MLLSVLGRSFMQSRLCLRSNFIRLLSNESVEKTEGEIKLCKILQERFPGAKFVNVEDISGGCGAMYDIQLEATEFSGKRTIEQHRMVNKALAEEIKDMHGLRINTSVPKE